MHKEVLRQQVAIRRDFLLTFQFSQGKDFPQRRYFTALGYVYQNDPAMPPRESLAGFVRESLGDMDRIKVPSSHIDLTKHTADGNVPELIKRQYNKQADAFEKVLHDLGSSASYGYTIARAATIMVGSDTDYMKKGRPGEKEDPYESLYREYVLLGRRVGSAAFGAILSDMRVKPQDTAELALLWENRHPGRNFYAKESDGT